MNRILFEACELGKPLALTDPRAQHITHVLGMKTGDRFRAGIVNGASGYGKLASSSREGWNWSFYPETPPFPLLRLCLFLGCPRPIVARRILRDMTSLGVGEIRICATELNEKSYLSSKLWRPDNIRCALVEGATQSGGSCIPDVKCYSRLEVGLENLEKKGLRLVCDSETPLENQQSWKNVSEEITKNKRHGGRDHPQKNTVILAIGPERGWSNNERRMFQEYGFHFMSLGWGTFRTETACTVAVGLVRNLLFCNSIY